MLDLEEEKLDYITQIENELEKILVQKQKDRIRRHLNSKLSAQEVKQLLVENKAYEPIDDTQEDEEVKQVNVNQGQVAV